VELGQQLQWAVEKFAAPDTLATLTPESRATLRAQLTGFLRRGLTAGPVGPHLVSDETLERAHARIRRIITEWLTTGRVVNEAAVAVNVSVLAYPPTHPAAGRPYVDVQPSHDDDAEEAVLRLMFLLGAEGRRVQACRAPAPRTTTKCGRWFVSRPNSRYCSRACYNRAATRRFRGKRTR
jgi:hypothetical protein